MKAALAAAVAALAAPAAAQDLPRFDVEAHCRAVASFGGNYSAVLDRGCFDLEQKAYDGLKGAWPSLPGSVRDHCTGVATFGGRGSYSLLEGCVKLETEATGNNAGRSFKY